MSQILCYEDCERCGYKTGVGKPPTEGIKRCWKCGGPLSLDVKKTQALNRPPLTTDPKDDQIAELQALLESKLGRQDGTCSKCSLPVYCHETYTVEANCTIICNDCAEVNP